MHTTFHKLFAIGCLVAGIVSSISSQITGELPLPFPAASARTDFNRDGEMDYAYRDADTIRIVTLDGFASVLLFSITQSNVRAISAGDINGDGNPEIVLTAYDGIRYIENLNGVPGAVIEAITGNFPIYGTEIFDYDLDGDGDMLINIFDIDISILENVNGLFDFNERIFITNTNKKGERTELHVCDFDQDGLEDVIMYNVLNGMLILLNLGEDQFGIDESFQVRNPAGFDSDDYNGDGYSDMFQMRRSFSQDSFELRIRTNPYGASPDSYTMPLGGQPNAIDAVDINMDLIPDIIIADQHSVAAMISTQGTYEYYLLWGTVDSLNTSEPLPYAYVDVVDLDSDGLFEIIHSDKDSVGRLLTTDWMVSGPEYACLELPDPLDCPPGDLVFTRQSEIDSFLLLYPYCSVLNGGLSLWGNITDVSPLRNVTRVNGNFHIEQTALSSIDPLNIFFVHGNVVVKDNTSLDAIILDELYRVQNDLIIDNNEVAQQINLDEVSEIGNNFLFSGHPLVERFETLRELTAMQVAEIANNDQLRVIESFDWYFLNALAFRLINNPNLDTIDGFFNSDSSSDLLIDGCPVRYAAVGGGIGEFAIANVIMSTLSPFANVYPYQMTIDNVAGLESLEDLDFYLNRLTINNCPELQRLHADLRVRNLVLRDNPLLTDLSGLTTSGLEELFITGNASLTSLASLADIPYIKTTLHLEGNASLTDIRDLQVEDISMLDSLIVVNNELLAACDAESICDYLDEFSTYRISGNATGCHTASAVSALCGPAPPFNPDPTDDPGEHTPFPNPALDDIWSGGDDLPSSMRLYDHMGRLVSEVYNSNHLNVKEQRNGWYYLVTAYQDRIECVMIIIAQ
jgi:hypothetical protein